MSIVMGVALLAAAVGSYFAAVPQRTMAAIPVLAVLICLSNLAGFWMAFGRQVWRFGVAAVPLLTAAYFNWLVSSDEVVPLACFFCGVAAAVALTGTGLRLLFGNLERGADPIASDALQFSLWHVFIVMTVFAVLVALAKALMGLEGWNVSTQVVVIVSELVAAISLLTVVSIWALLSQQITWLRFLVLSLTTLVVAFSVGAAISISSWSFWVPIVLLEQTLMVSVLLCIRAEQYRFVKAV